MGLLNVHTGLRDTQYEEQTEYLENILNNIDINIDFQEYEELKKIYKILKNPKYLPKNLNKNIDVILAYAQEKIQEVNRGLDEIIHLMFRGLLKQEGLGTPFGRYTYDANKRSGQITINFLTSFIFCIRYEINFKSFLINTYAHELAHAYNHLGQDKDGGNRYWKNFHEVDLYIKEGLAEFYSFQFAQKYQQKYPYLIECFEKTYNDQNFSEEYYEYRNWENTLEEVYMSMIIARRQDIKDINRFRRLLQENKKVLRRFEN